ncbi:hypothetical protein CALCODRAFT_509818 [Calocera cornea HHB12733]|uniref:Uncharacterized protein n=1 Tax=Calocera cornea HHB12733 TaxID=1353952 RepID=A0A165EZB1_9BASI|nr:hypothetical protein CALCODRAFT_509818 [Calocera cornea HHB12733]
MPQQSTPQPASGRSGHHRPTERRTTLAICTAQEAASNDDSDHDRFGQPDTWSPDSMSDEEQDTGLMRGGNEAGSYRVRQNPQVQMNPRMAGPPPGQRPVPPGATVFVSPQGPGAPPIPLPVQPHHPPSGHPGPGAILPGPPLGRGYGGVPGPGPYTPTHVQPPHQPPPVPGYGVPQNTRGPLPGPPLAPGYGALQYPHGPPPPGPVPLYGAAQYPHGPMPGSGPPYGVPPAPPPAPRRRG